MEKLKTIFSPGHDKDDEILYGTPQKATSSVSTTQDTPEASSPKPASTSGASKSEPIAAAAPTSTQAAQEASPLTSKSEPETAQTPTKSEQETSPASTEGEEKEKKPSLLKKIFSRGDKDKDPGETTDKPAAAAAPTPSSKAEAQEAPQATSGTNDYKDAAEIGTAGAAVAGTSALGYEALKSHEEPKTTEAPTQSASTYQTTPAATTFTTDQTIPAATTSSTYQTAPAAATYTTGAPATSSNKERDAELAAGGLGAAGIGGLAHEARKENAKPQKMSSEEKAGVPGTATLAPFSTDKPTDEVAAATYTARSYPLASGKPADPILSSAHADLATIDPDRPSEGGTSAAATHHHDASLAGAGVAGAGAGYVGADELKEFMEHKRDPEVDNATYTSREQYIGRSADADTFNHPDAGLEAALGDTPHVPGEYPIESGQDPHGSTREVATRGAAGVGTGSAAAGVGTGSAAAASLGLKDDTPANPTSNISAANTAEQVKPETEHHYGRDAASAAAVGGAGLGAYELSKDRDEKKAEPHATSTGAIASQPAPAAAAASAAPAAAAEGEQDKKPGFLSRILGRGDKQDETGSDKDREAALGTAGVGAAGIGAYELGKDHKADESQAAAGTQATDPAAIAAQKAWQNTSASTTTTQPTSTMQPTKDEVATGAAGAGGIGAYEIAKDDKKDALPTSSLAEDSRKAPEATTVGSSSAQPAEQHHYGRDAAVGTAGVGAAGLGAYELSKDHDEKKDAAPTSYTTGDATKAPESTAVGGISTQPTEQHHYGRDAAVGTAGVGAVGLGAYELSNDRDAKKDTVSQQTSAAPTVGTTKAPETTAAGQTPTEAPVPQEQHHYGRDAGIAAGTGAAGVGAYELAKDHEQKKDDTVAAAATTSSTPSDPTEEKEKKPGLFSKILHRGDKKKEDEAVAENEKDDKHYGRDAAVVGGTAVAGTGAYELAKHEEEKKQEPEPVAAAAAAPASSKSKATEPKEEKPKKVAEPKEEKPKKVSEPKEEKEKKPGLFSKILGRDKDEKEEEAPVAAAAAADEKKDVRAAPHGYVLADAKKDEPAADAAAKDDHHYGRDAAVVGGAGAVGAGAYELAKDEKDKKNADEPAAATTGQTQPTTTQTSADEGPLPSQAAHTSTNVGQPPEVSDEQAPADQHHYGRDAAVVGGAAAGAGGVYELAKHEEEKKDQAAAPSQAATGAYAPTTSAEAEEPTEQHHYGRDAFVATGATATAGGAYEYAHHDDSTPPESNKVSTDESGHHKLHKKAVEQPDKHEQKLAAAREEEAEKGGDRGEQKEKHGLIHKILHPREHKREKEALEERQRTSQDAFRSSHEGGTPAAAALGLTGATGASEFDKDGPHRYTDDGRIIEPHTGLPMDVDKYDTTGEGGTDAAPQIHGYNETKPAV